MKQKKLLWQIFPANLLVIIGTLIAVGWYGSMSLREFYFAEAKADLVARAHLVRGRVVELVRADDLAGLRTFCTESGREATTRMTVIDMQGVVLADSNENPALMDNHGRRPEILDAFTGEVGTSTRFSGTVKEHMLYVAIPFNNGKHLQVSSQVVPPVEGVVRMSVPVTAIDKTLASIRTKGAAILALAVILAAGVTLLVSRNITRPLEEMRLRAEKYSSGDFSQRMLNMKRISASLEIAALASAMDHMAEQLNERFDTIESQRKKLETVFSCMVEAVVAVDSAEHIINMNGAAAAILGISLEKAQGKLVQEVVRNVKLQQQISRVLATQQPLEDEISHRDQQGEHSLQVRVVPLRDSGGVSVGVLVVMNDVTNLRRLESVRRDFVANVSHELRTPVTSIAGYVETLLDGALENKEDSRRFLEIVLRQSHRLNEIIEDLLSLSRIELETERGEILLEKGNLHQVLDAAIQLCLLKGDQAQVKFVLECPENLEVQMNGALLEQAVVNLLVNAIKYSPPGGTITVSGETAQGADGDSVLVGVRDEGVGIRAVDLPRLFERFYRVDKARSRELGGTGLGLAIVKHIINAHGGSVDVESSENKGSLFRLQLPLP